MKKINSSKSFGPPRRDSVEAVCDKHGPYTAARLCFFGATFVERCPRCEAEWEAIEAEKERARKKAAEEARLSAMGIGRKYWGSTLENYQAKSPSQKAAVNEIKALMESRRGFLVLTGSFGVGKTHLGCAAVREMGGAIWTMADISTRIRATYSPRAKETEQDVQKELCSTPFLVIDELGRTKMQEADANCLSHIVNKRYSNELPTMLLSNKMLASELPKDHWEESFEAMVGDDVAQRLMGDGKIIALKGENWRSVGLG